MTFKQYDALLWEIACAGMAMEEKPKEADKHLLAAMKMLKEITGCPWPDWLVPLD